MAGEFDIIAKYFAPLAAPEGLGLLDDAACLSVPVGQDLVVTKDLLIEGVHFVGDEDPASLAAKALAVNLSDLAAKGARPTHYWLGLAMPHPLNEGWVAAFSEGLSEIQQSYGCMLAGGDTTASKSGRVISITAVGTLPVGMMTTRGGARLGDHVYVSGTLGDAALGLRMVQGMLNPYEELIKRYQRPCPRVGLGQSLRGVASACADVSDGLLADLGHICHASGLGARISLDALPMSSATRHIVGAQPDLLPLVYAGGDDYELVFTVSPDMEPRLAGIEAEMGVGLTKVGTIVQGEGCHLVDLEGELLQTQKTGYQHF